jgi:hypothetical protein
MDGMKRIDRAKTAAGGHQPGHGYKRNFNHGPAGRFGLRMARGKASRSKSSRS